MQRGTIRPRSSSPDEDSDNPPPRQRQRHSSISSEPHLNNGSNHRLSSLPPVFISSSIPPSSYSPIPSDQAESHTPIRHLSATPTPNPVVVLEESDMVNDMGPPLPSSNGHGLNSLLPTSSSNHATTSSNHSNPSSSNLHSSSPEAGPSNGHVASSISNGNGVAGSPIQVNGIRRVQLEGSLMYPDDAGWTDDHQPQDVSGGSSDLEMGQGFEGWQRRKSRIGEKRMPVEREEVIRLMLQGLRDIGYNQSADVLEAESGYVLCRREATDFQAAILGGRWSEALALMSHLGLDMDSTTPQLPIQTDDPPASSSNSVASMKTAASTNLTVAEQARFLIAQQKYLEFLEVGQQKKALNTLRQELAPIIKNSDRLHNLSGYMMCLDKDDLYERASWDGAAGTSRTRLLEHLQTFISPQTMLPHRRLATLLDQARRHQALSCVFHQDGEAPSLYVDHECNPGQFPSLTTHVLADHTDEVWRIEWSPDGLKLASAGKDKQVVIWGLSSTPKADGGTFWSVRPLSHLKDHRDPVDCMAWSPDGETLVTAAGKSLYLWDTNTGLQKPTGMGASPHTDQISAIQWKPDGSEFLVASMDCKLVFYSSSGNVIRQWSFNHLQISDFVITPEGTEIVAVTTSLKRVPIENKLKPSMSARPSERRGSPTGTGTGTVTVPQGAGDNLTDFGYSAMEHTLMVIRLADKDVIDWSDDLHCEVTGMKMSWDGKRILMNCNPDHILLWNISPLRPLRTFKGHIQSRFLIRSGFGAAKDRFVISGSEDNHVYVWQSNMPHPVQVLAGHSGTVNCVAWNPITSRRIFASCSDDGTVRIWQPPEPVDDLSGAVADLSSVVEQNGNDGVKREEVISEENRGGMAVDAEGGVIL